VAGQEGTHALDGELGDLWLARDTLDQAGWGRLYTIVYQLLINYRPRELASLDEERDHYVQEFFDEKVMRRDAVAARVHVGALKTFYRRFLIDQIRELSTRRKYFADSTGIADDGDDGSRGIEACAGADPNPWGDPGMSGLVEAGLAIEAVRQSARDFLLASEHWVPVYLAFSFCPDSDTKEPLNRLAVRLRIKSHHYKATDLGINWDSGKASRPFGETRLGRWVAADLGIAISPENQEIMLAAFKILCFEALNWAETCEEYHR
jgi:hypothetical protein